LRELVCWVDALDAEGVYWLWTDYMANGDERHPYEKTLKTHFRVLPFVRRHDSRPTGTADRKEEVVILGSVVDGQDAGDMQMSFDDDAGVGVSEKDARRDVRVYLR
jgi:hypothetical protein